MERIYCGPPPQPHDLYASWNFDPVLLLVLLLAGLLIQHRRQRFTPNRRRFLWAGWWVLVIAFVSPLCALSSALFSARVVHHLLIVLVAAPLFAIAVQRTEQSRTDERRLPLFGALLLSTAILWLWHAPPLYDLALAHVGVYWVMQVSLLAGFFVFWSSVLSSRSIVETSGVIVGSFAQMGLLGAILTFAASPLYEAHAIAPFTWGLTPLTDQQLGGLLMWVPAGIPYAAMLALTSRAGWRRLAGSPA